MFCYTALKTLFAYIIFFAFALRPVMNIGYMLYYELNVDYIIENYCVNTDKPQLQCNGKCYLSKQLQLQSQEDNNTQDTSYTIVESFYPLFYQETIPVAIQAVVTSDHKNLFPSSIGETSSYHTLIEEPPELLKQTFAFAKA